jgi:hypothetical protein
MRPPLKAESTRGFATRFFHLQASRLAFNKYKQMLKSRAIVALSDLEVADFFPGPLWGELENLLPGYRRVPLPLAGTDNWERLWRDSPEEILIAAWQTPSLNKGPQDARGSSNVPPVRNTATGHPEPPSQATLRKLLLWLSGFP